MRIDVRDVILGYERQVVAGPLTFSFDTCDTVGLLGKNGMGKTTLFRTLLRLIRPCSGSISIDGRDLDEYSAGRLAQVFSYVPQSDRSSMRQTVIDMVLMGRASHIPRFSSPRKEDYAVACGALERLGIQDLGKADYGQLSGGQRRMVLLARAMAQGSRMILMDEPASNLDYYNQKMLIDAIRSLTDGGSGVFMISHAPDHVLACCSRALLLEGGGTFSFGASHEVITKESLEKLYGVDVSVESGEGRGVSCAVHW
ncbi:MAG TPA: ABC transporter ATP-binding protein [Candidatus Coprousia avicola]|nr:ABC transporter ATP-binding protein [Candidatus Coprousia avicola]